MVMDRAAPGMLTHGSPVSAARVKDGSVATCVLLFTAVSVVVALVVPAGRLMVAELRLYAALVGSVTVTSACQALARVAVMVAEVCGLAPQAFVSVPLVDSQMVVRLADMVMVAR